MALTVNVDTYGTVAEADAYFNLRAFGSKWVGSIADKEKALRTGAVHLDRMFRWRGIVTDDNQAMKWPRANVVDDEYRTVPSATVPQAIKNAQFELALQWLIADQLTPNPDFLTADTLSKAETGAVKRERAGDLEREFFDRDVHLFMAGAHYFPIKKIYPFIEMLVRPYVTGISDSLFVEVIQ